MADLMATEGPRPALWARFLLAMLCLVLAFAAALFSTVSREQGHFWATLVLASLALVLATVVGLTTVPFLARRVAGNRVRDAFQFDVTRVGAVYVASIVLLGVAALNTGNNLLYIVVAVMLAAILVSGLASAMALRNLELDVRLPQRIFAGQPAQATVQLRNVRKRVPSFSVTVRPVPSAEAKIQWHWVRSTFVFPLKNLGQKHWLRIPDRQLKRASKSVTSAAIACGQVYFPFIAAASEASADIEISLPKRGRYRHELFAISTRFPFAFLAKTRLIAPKREVIVYPHLQPLQAMATIAPAIAGSLENFVRGQGSELHRLREYQPPDSVRHVDWKATAKSGTLMVREFSGEGGRRVRVVFDNPPPGSLSHAAYENAVSLAASVAWSLSLKETALSFISQECLTPALDDFLVHLAALMPRQSHSLLPDMLDDGAFQVIFTAAPKANLPARLLQRSYVIDIGDPNHGSVPENV